MLPQILVTGTLELPHRLTDYVKSKRPGRFVEGYFDFVFDFIALNRLTAQGTEFSATATTPHLRGRVAWQAPLCDALTGNRPQFFFELGQWHDTAPRLLKARSNIAAEGDRCQLFRLPRCADPRV